MQLEKCSNFVIEPLGEIEDDVYDIEVENNHNFFGNGILVHNSVYVEAKGITHLLFHEDDDIQVKVDAIDSFVKEFVMPEVETATDVLADYMNAKSNKMVWEREVISDAMVCVAKKNYAMNVWDNEGVRHYGKPKLKVKGLESVKSVTPPWARDYLEECYKTVLSGTEEELQHLVKTFFSVFDKMQPQEIAQVISVNGIDKYYINGTFQPKCPKQVKAAVNFNTLLEKHDMAYLGAIQNGEKIKYLPLTLPNPTGLEVVGFIDKLPEEFGLHPYIDRAKVFDAAFKTPLKRFLDAIGYTTEKVASLEDFFL